MKVMRLASVIEASLWNDAPVGSRQRSKSSSRGRIGCPRRFGTAALHALAGAQDPRSRVLADTALQSSAVIDIYSALLAKRLDQAPAGDDRLAWAPAGRGIERRITPLSSGSPSSRRPST